MRAGVVKRPVGKGLGFAQRMREAAAKMTGTFSPGSLAEAAGVESYKERRMVHDTLRDFVRGGEVERLTPGVYRYLGRKRKQEKAYFMWRRLRKGAASVKDLMVFADAERSYVIEWLKGLVDQGLVVKLDQGDEDVYRLVKDPVAMPKNTAKAKRLREMRAERRARAMAALDDALILIQRARGIVAEEPEGE